MMWSPYDEDLSQNEFFKEIKNNHEDILKRAAQEDWIICIPRRGSLTSDDLSMNVILDHVLIQNDTFKYSTLSKKKLSSKNNSLQLEENNIPQSDIEILFEETHYIGQSAKYIVWCINWPLFQYQHQNQCCNNNAVLFSIQDCIDFLYSETFGHNVLEGIQKLCNSFWKEHEVDFVTDTLQGQRDFLGNLYSQCLQLCFRSDIISEKCDKSVSCLDNFKLSVETYMQYCLGKKLMYSVNTLQYFTDSMINKILRNSCAVTLNQLKIQNILSNLIVDAKYELSRINNYVTIIDKVQCLLRTFNTFNNKILQDDHKIYLTSDDFLQILVYLISQCSIPNWTGNLTYLKEFQFATFSNPDQINFFVTSLEAAIAFIESSQFFTIRQSLYHNVDDHTICSRLYMIFRDNRNVKELEQLLEKEKDRAELCHPLCSCEKCEQIQSQEVDQTFHQVQNSFNQNFVIMAAIESNLDFLEFLLSFDFDIDFRDIHGKTALHYAAQNGFQDILMLLMNAGADVNCLDNDKNTALHLSCDRGHDSCVKALIYSSPFVEVNLQNISGETPLYYATRWGYFDIVKFLLENGASVCIKNNRNISIYNLSPNYYITDLFKQFGSQKSNNIQEEAIKDRCSPLDVASSVIDCCYNKLPSFQIQNMLFGTRTKSSAERRKIELLLKAIVSNDLPLTCFYLGYNSNVMERYSNDNVGEKCHPLCTCAKCVLFDDSIENNVEQIPFKNSNDCKINVNMCDDNGFTPLHIAAQYGRTEILRVLLDSGAHLNVRTTKTFYSPLHLAVLFQRLQAVKELLKCGSCDIDAQDFKGNTPLFYACNKNNFKIIELLSQSGADCRKKNFDEKTVLQICEEKSLFRVCKILRESLGCSSVNVVGNLSKYSIGNVDLDSIGSDYEIL